MALTNDALSSGIKRTGLRAMLSMGLGTDWKYLNEAWVSQYRGQLQARVVNGQHQVKIGNDIFVNVSLGRIRRMMIVERVAQQIEYRFRYLFAGTHSDGFGDEPDMIPRELQTLPDMPDFFSGGAGKLRAEIGPLPRILWSSRDIPLLRKVLDSMRMERDPSEGISRVFREWLSDIRTVSKSSG